MRQRERGIVRCSASLPPDRIQSSMVTSHFIVAHNKYCLGLPTKGASHQITQCLSSPDGSHQDHRRVQVLHGSGSE